jgi:hypothetical protein
MAMALAIPVAVGATDGGGDGGAGTDTARQRVAAQVAEHVRERAAAATETDRSRDRIRDRVAGLQCDRDREVDRPADCRRPRPDHARLRPWLARCLNWIDEHTDLQPDHHLRYLWHLCHRVANHLVPV